MAHGPGHAVAVLAQHLSRLDQEELTHLATKQLRLVHPDDAACDDPEFLMEVVVQAHERRKSQRQAINELPLYPTETVLWDENVVPSVNYTGQAVLALPNASNLSAPLASVGRPTANVSANTTSRSEEHTSELQSP